MPASAPNKLPLINRRNGEDRREDEDPCVDMELDLYHRKRRKQTDRRKGRTLEDDYYAYVRSLTGADIEQANH